jgi:hypothetical protein
MKGWSHQPSVLRTRFPPLFLWRLTPAGRTGENTAADTLAK